MDYEGSVEARFIVRMGAAGWMVYDRQRKGPALLKNGDFAEKLTKERAEFIKRGLANLQPPQSER